MISHSKLENCPLCKSMVTIVSSDEGTGYYIPMEFSVLKKTFAEIVIDYISKDQGWEETEDHYRKHFGLEPKYVSQAIFNEEECKK